MIILGGNKVTGLYNAETAPTNCTYTVGDIVFFGGSLYSCINDNQGEVPSDSSPNWKLYTGSSVDFLNSKQEILEADSGKLNYIGPNGLAEYFKSHLGGLTSTGKLQVISDPSVSLKDFTTNSSFQLLYEFLTTTTEPIPFVPKQDCAYVIKTFGEMMTFEQSTIKVQEIIEFSNDPHLSYRSWIRSGSDLAVAPWNPTKGESFNTEYVQALNKIVSDYQSAWDKYKSFTDSLKYGNFYSFEDIPSYSPGSNVSFSSDPTHSVSDGICLQKDSYYKFYVEEFLNDISVQKTVDISPMTLNFLTDVNKSVVIENIKITRNAQNIFTVSFVSSNTYFPGSPSTMRILKIIKANKLIA